MPGVVVGTGRTRPAGPLIRWAAQEAASRGLGLTLVRAWDTPVRVDVELDAGVLPDVLTTATCRAIPGSPAAVLLAQEAELLVLGASPERSCVSHLTRTVLHHATAPVAIVPDAPWSERRRVAVGVCGTSASAAALLWAAAEARVRGAELSVVHACRPYRTRTGQLVSSAAGTGAGPEAGALDRVRRWVSAALGCAPVELHVTCGPRLEALLEAGTDADLLVVGRGVHPWFGRVLSGAVGDDVSALAACPVVVVPAGAEAADHPLQLP